ncbi:MAG: hypothetical protein F6K31_11370 [Symploca sp. SIO2G7]|nr:hypothetical protein [Symploca sp. SIO2G7]
MHFSLRYLTFLGLTAAVSFLSVSCGNTKAQECSQIIQVANKVVGEVNELTDSGKLSNPQVALQAADAMEKASPEMEAIEVKDEQLRNYQTSFVSMYRDTSQATRDFIAAFQKKDWQGSEIASTKLQKATLSESQLVTDINTYCSTEAATEEK